MKVALISEYNSLTTTGGTEYYTSMLAQGLVQRGFILLFISRGNHDSDIIEREIICDGGSYRLHLLPAHPFTDAEVRQKVLSHTWSPIHRILQSFEPDIIHLHTLSTFFNIRHIEVCRRFFRHIIFTSHIPGHFCLKGDMIRSDKRPCNGKIGIQCNLCLFTSDAKRGLATLLKGYVNKKRLQFLMLQKTVAHVVCTSQWQCQQLIRNGYPQHQLSVIRQALQTNHLAPIDYPLKKRNTGKLKVGYLGRLAPEKGASLLLHLLATFRHQREVEFVLGIPTNSDAVEMRKLQELVVEGTFPVKLYHHINSNNKAEFFREIDVLLIPSFCIETGPIVLLEAVYFGKLVLAPDIGGPFEFAAEFPGLIQLYQWNNAGDLERALQELKAMTLQNTLDYSDILVQKEPQFITDHMNLYFKTINQV